MLHVVIMAGGSGTRFWPASRRMRPKQLLSLVADRTLLATTVDRVRPLAPPERIWVVTSEALAEATRDCLPSIPDDRVLGEPVGRDTAACVGWAADVVSRDDPDAVCLVLPADHVIADEHRFRTAMEVGVAWVEAHGGLLTFGIRPTRPETGFGYLRVGDARGGRDGLTVHELDRFVEKPDEATARSYLEDGSYLWNSGMFAWRAADLRSEIARQLPLLAAGLDRIAAAGAEAGRDVLEQVYPTLPKTSVDYGIMEGAARRWTLPVDFGWSDVGSWPALGDLLAADPSGVRTRGRVVALDASDCIVVGDRVTVAAVGIRDLVVVATPDAVLVVPVADAQRVREVVSALEDLGWDEVL
jgi:mannose-1-phosphate guanylyltransferase